MVEGFDCGRPELRVLGEEGLEEAASQRRAAFDIVLDVVKVTLVILSHDCPVVSPIKEVPLRQ